MKPVGVNGGVLIVLFILVAAISVFATCADASPFLTCDPYLAGTVSYFLIYFDGGNSIQTPPVAVTGGVAPMYDLASMPVGNHTVTARACYGDPSWGEDCSELSVPFSFVRPAKPTRPVIKFTK
jgi:hypothetical protein